MNCENDFEPLNRLYFLHVPPSARVRAKAKIYSFSVVFFFPLEVFFSSRYYSLSFILTNSRTLVKFFFFFNEMWLHCLIDDSANGLRPHSAIERGWYEGGKNTCGPARI